MKVGDIVKTEDYGVYHEHATGTIINVEDELCDQLSDCCGF